MTKPDLLGLHPWLRRAIAPAIVLFLCCFLYAEISGKRGEIVRETLSGAGFDLAQWQKDRLPPARAIALLPDRSQARGGRAICDMQERQCRAQNEGLYPPGEARNKAQALCAKARAHCEQDVCQRAHDDRIKLTLLIVLGAFAAILAILLIIRLYRQVHHRHEEESDMIHSALSLILVIAVAVFLLSAVSIPVQEIWKITSC